MKNNIIITSLICMTFGGISLASAKSDDVKFAEVDSFLPNEPNLRKWDAPTVADLDQDGYVDLLLNDHGFSVKVVWNNKGTFSKPYDIIMGDMHGISVSDFNDDGKMDIIMARGGGSGSNARNSIIFTVDKNRSINQLPDFETPLVNMRGRTVKFFDIDKDGDVDLFNLAFPGNEKKGESENYLYENINGKKLVSHSTLPSSARDGQKVLLSDYNKDGYIDIFMYGHENLKVYKGGKDLSFSIVSEQVLPASINHITAITEIDYDNDGDLDLYISRGKDYEAGQTYYDKGKKTFGFFTIRGRFDFLLKGVGDVLLLENIQSQWPSKNVYLGESGYDYAFPGETHSGRDIRLVNSDSLGFPQVLDKKGTYIGYVGNGNWRIAGDIWEPFSGIVYNVDSVENKRPAPSETDLNMSDILLENQKGSFKDITKKVGINISGYSMGAASADFNNDGYQDIIVVPRGELVKPIQPYILMNGKSGKFEEARDSGVITSELGSIGLGIDVLDFNKDSKVDILIGNDRGKWRLFKNNLGNKDKALTVMLGRSPKDNAQAMGAHLELTSCNGTQTKVMGSNGAAYSTSGDQFIHFGLGECKKDVVLKVTWTSGEQVSKTVKVSSGKVTIGKL